MRRGFLLWAAVKKQKLPSPASSTELPDFAGGFGAGFSMAATWSEKTGKQVVLVIMEIQHMDVLLKVTRLAASKIRQETG